MAETVSPDVRQSAMKIEGAILRALQSVGQNKVAEGLGLSEGALSSWKKPKDNGRPSEFGEIALTLALLGLKAVPQVSRCYLPDAIEPLLALAKQRMAQIENVAQLEWDEAA